MNRIFQWYSYWILNIGIEYTVCYKLKLNENNSQCKSICLAFCLKKGIINFIL